MTDERAEPTSPEASEAPLPEPESEPVAEKWAKKFAGLVSESLNKQIADALEPVHQHMGREDEDRGKLLRILAELSGELGFVRTELKHSREEHVILQEKYANLAGRVDRHHEMIDGLRKATSDHAERIEKLERTGTYDDEE